MDIKELRMGNAIEQGVIHSIGYSDGKLGVLVLENSFMSSAQDFVLIDDCVGIPITESMFIQNDFKQQIGFYKLIKGEMFKSGGKTLEFATNDIDTWYAFVRDFNEGHTDDVILLRNDIRYAHEVQNIYFDLTKLDFFVK